MKKEENRENITNNEYAIKEGVDLYKLPDETLEKVSGGSLKDIQTLIETSIKVLTK